MDASEKVAEDLRNLYPRLAEGDMAAVSVFGEKATVDSPIAGKQQPTAFVAETRAWLARHSGRTEPVHDVVTSERVIHELLLFVVVDGEERELPIMLVAEVGEDGIRDLRVYHSTRPISGAPIVRPPLMQYTFAEKPPAPVDAYIEALGRGDAAAVDAVFEPDACVREAAGGASVHCGEDRTRWYGDLLSHGPVHLHLGSVTDDGETVVCEYMADSWGVNAPMAPQARAAAYQRGASGKLFAARIYDDVLTLAERSSVSP